MELEILPGRDAQTIIAVTSRQIIADQVLGRGEGAAGKFRAHHEDKVLPLLALIAIILLINTVKLQKLVIIIGKTCGLGISKRLRYGARKQGMRLFEPFVSG